MEITYLLRILVSAACGIAIGYERKNRNKVAGIRTHFVVAIGSALIMIVSKYGFQDQIGWESIGIDPSKMASQAVSGVGFLGAGIIFMQKHTIKGLTTAAGIWATSGIGLALGAGLYFIGIASTLIIILGQVFLHSKKTFLSSPRTEVLILDIEDNDIAMKEIEKTLNHKKVFINGLKTRRLGEDDSIHLRVAISISENFNLQGLVWELQSNSFVRSVEF